MSSNSNLEYDLFIFAGEASADLHGSLLIEAIHTLDPSCKIAAVAGPRMRRHHIDCLMEMEEFQVMGFTDVLFSLPSLMKKFFRVQKMILQTNPKTTLFIDYPGFNLRMQKSLRKKGFKGKLIQYICPTVWAWGKKRIHTMKKNLDLLLTIFPFEKECFANSELNVKYIGNPITQQLRNFPYKNEWLPKSPDCKVIAIFPGSRKNEIQNNIPTQLKAISSLLKEEANLKVYLSIAQKNFEPFIQYHLDELEISDSVQFIDSKDNYNLMRAADLAIATSGTITLELALHATPTIVTYAIKKMDRFIAQKIFSIDLPFYCIANIITKRKVFPELFGPHLTEYNLLYWAKTLLKPEKKEQCIQHCHKLCELLEDKQPNFEAARMILSGN